MSDGPVKTKKKIEYAPAGIWQCPRCKSQVIIEVNMTCPPACGNHKGGAFSIMEQVKKAKQGK